MRPAIVLKYTSSRSGVTGSKSGTWHCVAVDVCDGAPGEELRRDHGVRPLQRRGALRSKSTRCQIRPWSSSTARSGSASSRISPLSMMAILVHSSLTSSTMWVERRTTLFSSEFAQKVEKAHAFGRVEARRRLVHDHQRRIAQQRHGDAKALAHAARVATELLLAHVPQVRLPQERLDRLVARPAIGDAFQHGEVIEQALRAHLGIDAEVLRQVAEGLADLVFLADDVDLAEGDGAGVRLLERGNHAHQRGLAGAVGAEQAVHARRNRERDVLQRLHAVGVRLGDALNV